ncbi:putative membrane protein [Litorimonas taeanensis]|uniref:Putative membrane protein n=1 Tax=Litorimonas taeanensis TaxID=568099 RepID=A0A420WJ39_9PROT|nr:DUF2254 domain-containing protein [Litorimonas taeanensis]RKQ71044.1 putative membrane protein [Litorimonas taeanensis]
MNARLIKAWQDLQGSYYFLPSLMGLGAIILAFVTIYMDQKWGLSVSHESIFFSREATAARTILATIAGSMIGVAATTFSITMVAVTSAAGQYGPRLIGNFMRDRGNQVTLGTFTSTFIYCLLVLRMARTGEENGETTIEAFVPNISLLVAMGLTLLSVGVLIYFIHHVPETLNVGNITGRVGRRLRQDIEGRYASDIGEALHPDSINTDNYPVDKAIEIKAKAEGYVQAINHKALIEKIAAANAVAKIEYRPGDFVTKGDVIIRVWADGPIDDKHRKCFRETYAMGQERTSYQNTLFLADELVEILARALSPGVNDPFTAINCINWFHSALKAFLNSQDPSPFRADANGDLRIISYPVSFERLLSVICDQSRSYIASDRNTAVKMMTILTQLCAECEDEERKVLIEGHLKKLKEACNDSLISLDDRESVSAHYNQALGLIRNPVDYKLALSNQGWLGGQG